MITYTPNLLLPKPDADTMGWDAYWAEAMNKIEGQLAQGATHSVDGQVVVFRGTTGKALAAGNSISGIPKLASGVMSAAVAGTDYAVPPAANLDGKVLKGTAQRGFQEAVPGLDLKATGEITMWPTKIPPAGHFLCDGSAVSRTTYAALAAVLMPVIGSAGLIAVGSGSAAEITVAGNGLQYGDSVFFLGGSLPTGISENTRYWVYAQDVNRFHIASSLSNLLAGTYITISAGVSNSQSVLTLCPHGIGDGSTTFNLPNYNGRMPLGRSSSYALGVPGGAETITLDPTQMPVHTHLQNPHDHQHLIAKNGYFAGQEFRAAAAASSSTAGVLMGTIDTSSPIEFGQNSVTPTNQNTGSGFAHDNMSPFMTTNFIIKH